MTSQQLTKCDQHIATRQSKYNSPNAQRLQSDYLALPSLHLRSASGRPLDDRYSYFRFSGPVSGQVKKVVVPGIHGKAVDFVAYPKYHFQYGVKDGHTGDIKEQSEHRDGDAVKGEYSLVEPDGTIRKVQYEDDGHSGFNAIVTRTGHAVHPVAPAKLAFEGHHHYHR
nr:unnamed protein product [Callosobruchus analis]